MSGTEFRNAPEKYAEISNSHAVYLFGEKLALEYFKQDLFTVYQSRNGTYAVKYERPKYRTTGKVDFSRLGTMAIVKYVRDAVEKR